MGGIVVDRAPVGHAAFRQRLFQRGTLLGVEEQLQGIVVLAVPEIRRRVIRIHAAGDGVVVVPGPTDGGVHDQLIERPRLVEIVDGVGQQQGAGLGHIVLLVAQLLAAEQAQQVPAGGVAQQRVVLGLDVEHLGVLGDELHGPADVVQRGVVAGVLEDAVAHRKDGVALFVKLIGRGDALLQFGGAGADVAGEHQRILGIGGLGGEIVHLYDLLGGVGGDLLLRIELVGDLTARFVVFHRKVQARRAGFGVLAAHKLRQRLFVVVIGLQGLDVPELGVGPDARPLNTGVRADLAHRGLGGDGARRKRRQRQRHHQAKTAQRRRQLRSLFHGYAPLLPPGLHFSAKRSIRISCTSECSPNFFLYCITTDPFRKGFCQKKEADHRRLRRPRAGSAGRGAPAAGNASLPARPRHRRAGFSARSRLRRCTLPKSLLY